YKPLSGQDLRETCIFHLEDPEQLETEPFLAPHVIYQLMLAYVASTARKRPLSQREIAAAIDRLIDGGWEFGDARRQVAAETKKTEEAAAQTHRRFGRNKYARRQNR